MPVHQFSDMPYYPNYSNSGNHQCSLCHYYSQPQNHSSNCKFYQDNQARMHTNPFTLVIYQQFFSMQQPIAPPTTPYNYTKAYNRDRIHPQNNYEKPLKRPKLCNQPSQSHLTVSTKLQQSTPEIVESPKKTYEDPPYNNGKQELDLLSLNRDLPSLFNYGPSN